MFYQRSTGRDYSSEFFNNCKDINLITILLHRGIWGGPGTARKVMHLGTGK
jgi:hypothetical protein